MALPSLPLISAALVHQLSHHSLWAILSSAMCWVLWISCNRDHFLILNLGVHGALVVGASPWEVLHCCWPLPVSLPFVLLYRIARTRISFPFSHAKFH